MNTRPKPSDGAKRAISTMETALRVEIVAAATFRGGKGFRFCGSGHFLLSAKADGREKCKEWFRQMPKPPRPTGKPGGYDFSLPTAN